MLHFTLSDEIFGSGAKAFTESPELQYTDRGLEEHSNGVFDAGPVPGEIEQQPGLSHSPVSFEFHVDRIKAKTWL